MGKTGISDIAKLSFDNAQYAADMLESKTNFKILNGNRSFLKEFIITSNHSSTKIQNECIENSILIDRPLNDKSDKMLLLAFTEKRTKDEIDALVSFLSTYE